MLCCENCCILTVHAVLAVLLDEFDRAVVADIGLGKMANAESTVASGQTPLWASPEQRMVCLSDLLPYLLLTAPHVYRHHQSPSDEGGICQPL